VTGSAIEYSLDAAKGAFGLLEGVERNDAERLVELCEAHWLGTPPPEHELLVELGRLIEVLARRSAKAMPYAALGRALVAELRGTEKDRDSLLQEFALKLSMLGM